MGLKGSKTEQHLRDAFAGGIQEYLDRSHDATTSSMHFVRF